MNDENFTLSNWNISEASWPILMANFMFSITWGGERLHNVLRQIGSKLWCPWQQKAPIDLSFSVTFDPILFILAGNEDMHKISDEFEFRLDRTTDYGVSCP